MANTENKGRKRFYLIAAVCSFAAALGISLGFGLSLENPLALNCRHISDGFFIVGMVVTGVGGLMVISTTGFFDVFGYAFKSLIVLFTPLKRPSDMPKFWDYKTMKAERRGTTMWGLLLIGLALIAVSALALAGYYAF